MKTSKKSMLLRLLLVVGLAALMLVLFTAAASAATDIEPGSYWLYNLDRPTENTVYAPKTDSKPYVTKQFEITAVNLYVYNADGTHATYASGDYTPTLKDNVYGVKVAVVGRPADGYQWPDGDPSKIKLVWYGTFYAGGGNVVAVGEKRGTTQYAVFLFDAWVRGDVDTIDLSVPVPAAGNIPDNTLTFNAADDHGYSVQYVKWKVNNGSWGDGPAVWQGGDKVMVSVRLNKHSGCTFDDNLKIRLNGTQLSEGTEGDVYYYKYSTYYILYYAFNLADSLSTELDFTAGPVTVTNPDYKFGLAERYLNTLLTLANMPVPATYAEAIHDLDLNNDGKTDLSLAYKPRIPSGSNIRKSSIVITQGPGLYLAFGKKTEKDYSLTMDQQSELAGNSRVFWQKLKIKGTTPKVTIDPNGGAFKNGVTSPVTIQTGSDAKLLGSQLSDILSSGATDFAMTRDGYYVIGFAKTATATSTTYTSVGGICYTYTEDATWYVVWKKFAKITVDPNGGRFADGTSTPITLTCNRNGVLQGYSAYFSDSYQVGYNLTPPAGKLYAGLSTNKNAEPNGSGVTENVSSMTFSGDATCYVIWYTPAMVTVDPNGGAFPDGTTTPKTVPMNRFRYMSSTIFRQIGFDKPSQFLRDGYSFVGVSLSKTGELLYTKDNLYNMTSSYSGHIYAGGETLYIRWAKKVTVTLDLNGGAFVFQKNSGYMPASYVGPYTQEVVAGQKFYPFGFITSSGSFVRDTDKLLGWAYEKDAKVPDLSDYEAYVLVPENDFTLYLVWETPSALEILRHPDIVTKDQYGNKLKYGANVDFTLYAAGRDLTYQWQYSDDGFHGPGLAPSVGGPRRMAGTWRDMKGETDKTLTVRASYDDTAGRVYRCIVKDGTGATLESYECYCEPSFFIVRHPYNYVGLPGETAVFSVEVSAASPVYTWKAKDSGGSEVNVSSIPGVKGTDTAVLQVPITSALNDYSFWCDVYDAKLTEHEVSYSARLTVGKSLNSIAVTLSPMPKAGDRADSIVVGVPDVYEDPQTVDTEWSHLFRVRNPDFAEMAQREGYLYAVNYSGMYEEALEWVNRDDTLKPGDYMLYIPLKLKPGEHFALNPETAKITFNGSELRFTRDWTYESDTYLYVMIHVAEPHAHQTEKVNEVPATCSSAGTKAYYRCTVCGTLFSDAAGKNEIAAPETLPIDPNAHVWNSGVVTKEPTTEEEGEMTYTCTLCGKTKKQILPKKTPDDPRPGILLGDVNNDGEITAADARLALRGAVGLESYTPDSRSFKAADVNLDEQLTAADARLILRKAVGFSDREFGVKY